MLRILIIIAVALAVVIGLMQLAKHNNAVQAPEAASEAVGTDGSTSAPSGVVDAAGDAIETPAEPAIEPAAEPAVAPDAKSVEPAQESSPETVSAAQETPPVERPRRVVRKASETAAPAVDPYELQRSLQEEQAAASAPAPSAESPSAVAPTETPPAEAQPEAPAPEADPASPQPN